MVTRRTEDWNKASMTRCSAGVGSDSTVWKTVTSGFFKSLTNSIK
jgi:hypothetical protein